MSQSISTSESTITLTLSWEYRKKLEIAAAMRCMTLDEYLLAIALDAATQEIPERETILVSERDWEIITNTLENPPLPNETLKAAIQRHQEKWRDLLGK